MKTYFVKTIATLGFVTLALNAYADRDTHDPDVNARQEHQDKRIKRGVKSGELTKHEAKELRGDQRDVKQLEKAYKSDGTLTNAERKDLHHELNQNSKDIYKQKHDGQDRTVGGTGVGNPGTSGNASPDTRDPLVNARQQNQADRIQQGVQSGELTKREAGKLREERKDIKQLEQAYKSDGTLTSAERKDMHHELNELSNDIHDQKHDAQTR